MLQALPISLATTLGISVDFFSLSYLDVSVHSVRSMRAIYSRAGGASTQYSHAEDRKQKTEDRLCERLCRTLYLSSVLSPQSSEQALCACAGFPHSDISGSKLVCQLPEAFRRLPRPSSPVIAKASTTCTYSLDSIILRPLAKLYGSKLAQTVRLKTVHASCDIQYNPSNHPKTRTSN